jgi:DNA-binding transcriptional MerR regulator/methylmalonyl-CoA mutase cobalamin-binding subunit
MTIAYRIGAVSRLTGISTDTLRAWERRYAAVSPPRDGSRRDYNQGDVERLILLRRAVEKGHAIGSIARLPDAELGELVMDTGQSLADSPMIQPLLAALEQFDYASLNETLSRMAAVLPPREMVRQVVLPMMREVGERWHQGLISVAQEHMMSGLVQHLLGTLLALNRPSAKAPRVIFTTPEGEAHSLGVLAAAMLAADEGLSPIYLGPSLPPKEIVNAARRSGAKAVVLQITDSGEAVVSQIRKLVAGLPGGVELWLGGRVEEDHEGARSIRHLSELHEHYQRLAAAG